MVVDTASSAAIVIEKLRRRKYNGILSNHSMPDLNGMDLLRYVRAEIGNIPFIMFTGDGNSKDIEKKSGRTQQFFPGT
jgi:CheY-like chemotaxis protein